MPRLIAPDRQCQGVDIGPARYNGNRIDVTDPSHVKALKAVGYVDPGPGGPARGAGYECPACGFHGWFRRCSKCGTDARAGAPAAAHPEHEPEHAPEQDATE